MRVIIVDDEPKAIDLLSGYLNHFKGVELVGAFRNGLKAFEFLSNEKVDVVFLDINMPHITGISLSKMIDSDTKVIFTTAYSEYAVESYEVNAIDYLLKPISLERFTNAMSKLLKKSEVKKEDTNSTIAIKSGASTYLINTESILYLEKDGNYMTYHTSNEKIIARESVSEALSRLPGYFMQVQRSFIANTKAITKLNNDTIYIGKQIIPIGANFKESVFKKLTL
ncbi:LytR/AlgR family response regulator transcription factor [Ekhidna sp.]|uniref:LytR/AlgR family response regulator transcription factor n=1 Tax=Ekhidna sp. TaxID=2608089 RepID=UPI003B59C769